MKVTVEVSDLTVEGLLYLGSMMATSQRKVISLEEATTEIVRTAVAFFILVSADKATMSLDPPRPKRPRKKEAAPVHVGDTRPIYEDVFDADDPSFYMPLPSHPPRL